MRRSLDLRRSLSALLVLATLSGLHVAPAQKLSPQRKVAFAQGLAAELGFVDLAEGLLEEVRKEGGIGREELARATLQVIAKVIPTAGLGITSADPAERGQAFKERIRAYDRALTAYGEYLTSGADFQRGDTIVEMLKLLREKLEIAMRFIDDEDVAKEIRNEIARSAMEVDSSGRPVSPRHWATAVTEAQVIVMDLASRVERVEDAMWEEEEGSAAFLELEAQANALQQKRFEAMFMMGEVRLTLSKVAPLAGSAAESADLVNVARRSFADMALAAGDSSGAGMLATARMAECFAIEGRSADALRYFNRVFEAAVPSDEELNALVEEQKSLGWTDADIREYLRSRRIPMCAAYEASMRIFREKNLLPEALAIADRYLGEQARWQRSREPGAPAWSLELGQFREANEASLQAALTLALAGRYTAALRLVSAVSEANTDRITLRPANTLGRKAQRTIRAIAEISPPSLLSPREFYAAGVSAFMDKNYEASISFFRRTLQRFDERGPDGDRDLVEEETFLATTYEWMTRAYYFLYEAGAPRLQLGAAAARHTAMVFTEADERMMSQEMPACRQAGRYRSWTSTLEQEHVALAPVYAKWKEEASYFHRARCQEGVEEGEFSLAIREFNADRYPRARSALSKISEAGHPVYFQARVLEGMCDYELGQFEDAIKKLDGAMDYLADRKKADANFRARSEASYLEKAQYYAGRAHQRLSGTATGDDARSHMRLAVRLLSEVASGPRLSNVLVSNALYYTTLFRIQLGELDQAKKDFAELRLVTDDDAARIARPAFFLYRAVRPEKEIMDALDRAASLEPRLPDAEYAKLRDGLEYLRLSNSGSKSWGNALNEARILMELAKLRQGDEPEQALAYWLSLVDEPEYQKDIKDLTFMTRPIEVEIARAKMLIGGLDNMRDAARTVFPRLFYDVTVLPSGEKVIEDGWQRATSHVTIKVLEEPTEKLYLRDGATTSDAELIAMAFSGWVEPDFKGGGDPKPRAGLGQLLFAKSGGAGNRSEYVRAHQIGKEVWAYLQQIQQRRLKDLLDEDYLMYWLNYNYASLVLARNLNSNTSERDEIRKKVDRLKEAFFGGDWNKVDAFLPEGGKGRKAAWVKALGWLEAEVRR